MDNQMSNEEMVKEAVEEAKKAAMEAAMAADLAALDGGLMPEAMDKYLGIRYPQPATLLDYFADPIFVIDEPWAVR